MTHWRSKWFYGDFFVVNKLQTVSAFGGGQTPVFGFLYKFLTPPLIWTLAEVWLQE